MGWLNNLFTQNKRIFLDYASATPVRPEARKAMERYWSEDFHNPSAIYQEGVLIKKELDEIRKKGAKILGTGHREIIFTGSGTESVNLAILGAFEEAKKVLKKPHLIVSAIEHPAVLRAGEEVLRRGGEICHAPVDENGIVKVGELKKLIRPNTFLVSVSLANSEVGAVQPVSHIGRLVKEERKSRTDLLKKISGFPLMHTDASAAPAYLQVNLERLQCDMLTLDGAKICGPKGIGLLAMRRGIRLTPILFGGGQERGLRSGTQSLALITGFITALELAEKERDQEYKRMEGLRAIFKERISKDLPMAYINEAPTSQLPNILSISVPGVLSEFVVLKLDALGVMASVGTACSLDERISGSPVIRAMGKDELSESTIRFSFGRFTTENEVKKAAQIFCEEVQKMLK